MITNFEYSAKDKKISWHFKAQNKVLKLENPQIVKCYEYLDRIFVISLKGKNTVLSVYDSEANLSDEIESKPGFIITGFRSGVINPEVVIRENVNEPSIYIYDVKKKTLKKTDEVV